MSQDYELIELKNDDTTEIRYVYHISDIHIRNTQRHEEYNEIFEKLYKMIKSECQNQEKYSIIVLTGDIFHTKTEIIPEAYNMATLLFKNLSKILPVILIPGNHDCIISKPNRMDSLTPIIMNGKDLNEVYYIKKTGLYRYHNIIFGLTDMYTNTLTSETITTSMLRRIKQQKKYKIALFHGQISGSKTDLNYEIINKKFRIKDFEGYDFGFLGDIHKHQYMNKKKTIAYAGSLIQQSHGETLNNHGILKWDLESGESNLLEIPNSYGYCKINVIKGKIIDKIIPKTPRIKFILEDTTQLQFQELKEEIEKKYGRCEIMSEYKLSLPSSSKNNKDLLIIETDHNKFIKHFIENKIADEKMCDKIYELHQKIYNKIIKDNKSNTNIEGDHWKLIELKFSNMFSYGEDNIINFTKYNKYQIIGIVAPNHHGKSSILDIILYCLFETSSRGNARNIMNKKKKEMTCSLLFNIGDDSYLIERSAQRGRTDARMHLLVNFVQIKNDGKQESLNDADKRITNNKIIELIGTYNDYLTSYICTQDKNGNFINKTNLKKKEYLYEILKLNIFEDCYKNAKNKLKKINANTKSYQKEIDHIPIKDITIQMEQQNNKILIFKKEKKKIQNLLELINLSLTKEPKLITFYELLEYDIKSEKDIDQTINILKKEMKNINIIEIYEQLNKHTKLLNTMKKEDIYDKLINEYNNNIQSLYDNILYVSLINEKNNELKEINKILNKLNEDLKSTNKIDQNELTEKINKILNKLYEFDNIKIKNELVDDINKKNATILKLVESRIMLQMTQEQVSNIKLQIQNIKINIQFLIVEKLENESKIKKLKDSIKNCKNIINNNQKYIKHINLLNEYKFLLIEYFIKNEIHIKNIKTKNNLDMELNNISHALEINEIKMTQLRKLQEDHGRLNTQLNDVKENKELYESYCQIINTNGIPYEILKTLLPQIETNINQILHNMVDFNVEFMYNNEEKQTKKNKVKTINAIDINIYYPKQKSYEIGLTSGFEKFIIGLAIRMTLCNISKSAKPNFFIIDEGWSCLDTDNLSNIDNIILYIKNQFEHVIIISHLEELKSQSDYIININRKNIGQPSEYSQVNNFNGIINDK